MPETDVDDMRERISQAVDLIIDGDHCGMEPTTVIDMVEGVPHIVRQGCGVAEGLGG